MNEFLHSHSSVTPSKLAYSVDELAQLTSLSKAYIRNEIRCGALRAQRFGRRVLVLAEEAQRYLSKQSQV